MKTSVLAPIAAVMFLSFTSARATSPAPKGDEGPDQTAPRTTELLDAPRASDAFASSDADDAGDSDASGPLDTAGATRETRGQGRGAKGRARGYATGTGPGGTFTLADTLQWMHAEPPPSRWAEESVLDRPELVASATAMWLAPLDELAGGARLSTAGSGGGAGGEGVAVRVATVGHGDGEAEDAALGPSIVRLTAEGKERQRRAAKLPNVNLRDVDVLVGQGLPRATVQAVVRQSYPRISACYAAALRSKPELQGRVAVRFVIGVDGSVALAQDAGSALSDTAVVQCVVRNFQSLSFPVPEGGSVIVTYPLLLAPGAAEPAGPAAR